MRGSVNVKLLSSTLIKFDVKSYTICLGHLEDGFFEELLFYSDNSISSNIYLLLFIFYLLKFITHLYNCTNFFLKEIVIKCVRN